MRVKFKNKENRIEILECFNVYETTSGIDIHYAYASWGLEIQGASCSFCVDNAKELLHKAFETGLLDLTDASLIND